MSYNKKCVIVGKFAFEDNILDGQTVKCKMIYEELCNKYGVKTIKVVDTYKWKKHPLKILIKCVFGIKKYENVIILPAQNGIKVFLPLFSYLNILFRRKIYYIVIGGWLYDKIKNLKLLKKSLLNFDKIFVETTLLKQKLEHIGFKNVEILRNYKKLKIINKDKMVPYKDKKILKACMFSRVNKEKGILDAIETITEINKNGIKFQLDIYGMIEKQFKKQFKKALKNKEQYIRYNGIIDSKKSVDTIKKYDILLFPTKYLTEGIPGTIIDSYAAGVPVLASSWENCLDIIVNYRTGIIFEFNNITDMRKHLNYIYENQKKLYKMKFNCIEQAKLFCEINALQPLFYELER